MAKTDPKELSDDPELFPELNPDQEDDKKLIKLLKRFSSDNSEHAESVRTLKKKKDESKRAVINKMHERGLERVRWGGKIYERRPGDEDLAVSKYTPPQPE